MRPTDGKVTLDEPPEGLGREPLDSYGSRYSAVAVVGGQWAKSAGFVRRSRSNQSLAPLVQWTMPSGWQQAGSCVRRCAYPA
jgi:hypothetical protein